MDLSKKEIQISARTHVLTLLTETGNLYAVDREGRFVFATEEGWLILRGLGGRWLAKRWKDDVREIRSLTSNEATGLLQRFHKYLNDARTHFRPEILLTNHEVPVEEIPSWMDQAAAFDLSEDEHRFETVYGRVGILPPDQYMSLVLQVTESCEWNRCSFCSFYRGQPFRLKTREEFSEHVRNVKNFLGRGLLLRVSIFLGEANALAVPTEDLLAEMRTARELLSPEMMDFRGFYAFMEPNQWRVRHPEELRRLKEAGLQRLYCGIETGDPELRRVLRKPGSLEQELKAIRDVKNAGISVGIIVLAGAGGKEWGEQHTLRTSQAIRDLPLDKQDLVYISPLHPAEDGKPITVQGEPLSPKEIRAQAETLRKSVPSVRSAIYDVREFVY